MKREVVSLFFVLKLDSSGKDRIYAASKKLGLHTRQKLHTNLQRVLEMVFFLTVRFVEQIVQEAFDFAIAGDI